MTELSVRNLRPDFGVEISGLTPRVPLDEGTCRELKKLFDERSLLIFRDFECDLAFQTYLSLLLIGEDVSAGNLPPLIEYYVSNKEPNGGAPFGRLMFHSDMMWVENGCQLLSLYGMQVEEPSIPTLFISGGQAWADLPPALRARVEGRFALHGQDATYQRRDEGKADVLASTFKVDESVRLPIGYRHPRTGRTILYACQQMTQGIADLPSAEGEELLEALFDHLYQPSAVLEHVWRKGDLVVWDNIALQHARPNVSTDGPARTLRKVFAPMPRYNPTVAPKYNRVGT